MVWEISGVLRFCSSFPRGVGKGLVLVILMRTSMSFTKSENISFRKSSKNQITKWLLVTSGWSKGRLWKDLQTSKQTNKQTKKKGISQMNKTGIAKQTYKRESPPLSTPSPQWARRSVWGGNASRGVACWETTRWVKRTLVSFRLEWVPRGKCLWECPLQ